MILIIKKKYLIKILSFLIFLFSCSVSAQKSFWAKINKTKVGEQIIKRNSMPKNYTIYHLDLNSLQKKLINLRFSKNNVSRIKFPYHNQIAIFNVKESSALTPALQNRYPEIRSYIGVDKTNTSKKIYFSISPEKGISAMIMSSKDGLTIIDPYTKDKTQYIVFKKSVANVKSASFVCLTKASKTKNTLIQKIASTKSANDGILRTYKLALSATGEYTQFQGGTKTDALAAMNATVTRINGIFETEFDVKLVLLTGVDTNGDNDADGELTELIYTDPATDPYDPTTSLNSQIQTNLTNTIGEANYDLGDLFHKDNVNDGNAGCVGCVCVDGSKGSGYMEHQIPQGDDFDLDFVAHELGHQFGANHTWTHAGSESTGVQMEPGSGSTIMGYAGITGKFDVQAHSDAYFHAISIQQITNYIKTTSCQTETATGNTTPTVNAGNNYTIPSGTAFKLQGFATDADGDNLTYCWEEMDQNDAATTFPSKTATDGVTFRSFPPTAVTYRYFPVLKDVLNGNLDPKWEVIPTVSRTLNFRLTVRDNKLGGGSNNFNDMQVNIDSTSGPFKIISPAKNDSWISGSTYEVKWDVANSTNANVNAQGVNIYLSTNNGKDLTLLKTNTPNDGIENITIPTNSSTTEARIFVEGYNTIFYAVSPKFGIDYSLNTVCNAAYVSTDTPMPIDSIGTPTITSTINVPDNFTIEDVNVNLNISHSYTGDLTIYLTSPSGTKVNLIREMCNSYDDIDATFDDDALNFATCSATPPAIGGTIKPNEVLGSFNDENALGNWTLTVEDAADGDGGLLNSWNLELCKNETTPLVINQEKLINLRVWPNPALTNFNVSFLKTKSKKVIIRYLFSENSKWESQFHSKNCNSIISNSFKYKKYVLTYCFKGNF